MNKYISVPISTECFLGLVEFLRQEDSNLDPVETVETAIDYWVDNASWKQEDLLNDSATSKASGYTWKNRDVALFLPHGTKIRMRYKGDTHYALVEGDQIIYGDEAISPATLANTIAKSSRNAWRDLWIFRPRDSEWQLADHLRRREHPSG